MKQVFLKRFWDKVDRTKGREGCWLWTGATNGRYGKLMIDGKLVQAHIYAWETIYGPMPEDLEYGHLCHNPLCVRPTHGRPVTHEQNMQDMIDAGRQPKLGGVSGRIKLKEYQVLATRFLSRIGYSYRRLSEIYGVHHTSVGEIVRRQTWKHI